jgi:hypothetical protein
MKVVIQSTFHLRGKPISSYYSFPVYSDEIEKNLSRQLKFLSQYDDFSLSMEVKKSS